MAKELSRPKVDGSAQRELDKAQDQLDNFNSQIKEATADVPAAGKMDLSRLNMPQSEVRFSQNQINNSKEIHLRPIRSIGSKEKFNERFREAFDFDKQTVAFIAEHKELQGEGIEIWTKPYPGVPCEEWKVPTGKPVWGPRYLAEQIKRKYYNRLTMNEQQMVSHDSMGSYTGQLVVAEKKARLECQPVVTGRSSVFMGSE